MIPRIDTKVAITIRELAEYVIYQDVRVAFISPTRFDQRMSALAFGVMCDNLLPECAVYHSQPRRLDLEIGSRVYFYESREMDRLRSHKLHAVCFEQLSETTDLHYRMAQMRCRYGPDGLGVRFLGR